MDLDDLMRNKPAGGESDGVFKFVENVPDISAGNQKKADLEKGLETVHKRNEKVRTRSDTNAVYVVSVDWDDDQKLYGSGSRVLGVFRTKEKAADYIEKVSGMRVNDGWFVRIYEEVEPIGPDRHGYYRVTTSVIMQIERCELDTWEIEPDWTNVESIREVLEDLE